MEGQLYPLGFDPTASSADNLVLDERHIIGLYKARKQRAVILEKGHFYVDTLKVRDVAGRTLTLGQDYVTVFANGEASSRTGKGVAGGVLILSAAVEDRVYIDAQMVGGEYCFLGNILSSVMGVLENDTRSMTYNNINGKPNTFTATRHKHSLAQTYGWEVFKTELVRITNAIQTVNKRDMSDVRDTMKASSAANTSRIEALSNLIDQHIKNTSNPHQLTLRQVNLEYYEGRYIVQREGIYDNFTDDQFLTPAAIKRYLVDQAYVPFKEHVDNTNNPHQLTLRQISASSATDISLTVNAKYGKNDQVVNTNHLNGRSYAEVIAYMRSNLDASRVMNGTLDMHRLGTGTPSATTVLVNGKWTNLSDIFAKYTRPKPKLLYAGDLGYEDSAINTLASRYSDMSAYPIGTGVLYGEAYISYNDIGPSIWCTKGVLMQLAVRQSQNDWARIRIVEHSTQHRIEDAATNVWWY